jgi:hypothetical protein
LGYNGRNYCFTNLCRDTCDEIGLIFHGANI